MKFASFILILAFVGSAFSIRGVKRQIAPPQTKNAFKFEDQWFPQKLDHFDITGMFKTSYINSMFRLFSYLIIMTNLMDWQSIS